MEMCSSRKAGMVVAHHVEHYWKVVPNRFQRDQTAFVLDMEYFALSSLRNMEVEALAKTGDTDKSQMICEYTLEVRNEAASGKITDLTAS